MTSGIRIQIRLQSSNHFSILNESHFLFFRYNGVYARCDVTKIMATKSATFSTPIGILEEFIRKTRLNEELWYEIFGGFLLSFPRNKRKIY